MLSPHIASIRITQIWTEEYEMVWRYVIRATLGQENDRYCPCTKRKSETCDYPNARLK